MIHDMMGYMGAGGQQESTYSRNNDDEILRWISSAAHMMTMV